MSSDLSGDQFAHIVRDLSSEPGVTETLEYATATALKIVDNCDHAGISLVGSRRTIETVAPTDEVASRADRLQYDVGEGPSLESISEHETVYAPDLRTEARWPRWASRAAGELGIESVLALQLFVGTDTLGSLNLYSQTVGAFRLEDRVSALALAAHIAVAMTSAKDHEQLESALAHRTVIGQAEGMLMQGFTIDADRAFAALIRVSQSKNLKLHVVASDIVKNGIRRELFD